MKAVLQRVSSAKVTLKGDKINSREIKNGILVLLGAQKEDSQKEADFLLDKILNLRIFEDSEGKMNLSLLDTSGDLMIVSQFTILADTKKGRRPSFHLAEDPQKSSKLVQRFIKKAKESVNNVQSGWFGQHMEVDIVNNGPVTIILESR